MWIKDLVGNYVSLRYVWRMRVEDNPTYGWLIYASTTQEQDLALAGAYATEAEARRAMQSLVHGYDPAGV